MKVYFLSGLGADKRAFERTRLPSGYEICHIPWEAVSGNESIATYAKKLAQKIDSTQPFMLAGLSFGGLVAREICKFIKPEKLILLSTIRTSKELPSLYKLAGKSGLYKILPASLLPLILPFLYWFFGPLNKEGRKLVAAFLKQTNPLLLKWSLGIISCWKNEVAFEPCLHIHGSRDRAFPVRLSQPNYIIKGGGHFCVLTHAEEVNKILAKELHKTTFSD